MIITNNKSAQLFQEAKPAAIRLWHWLAFLFFTASIVTVLFGSTLFKTNNNISMIQEQVSGQGGTITQKQARSIAHEYSDKLWMVHKYIGFGLSFLLLWRMITEFFLSKDKRLRSRILKALRYPAIQSEKTHYLLVQYGYVIFYLLFILMAVTGLVLAFEEIKWLDPIHNPAKNIHRIVQYGLYAYILVHIVGVIRADLTKYGGIVSRMINGNINAAR